MRICAFVTETAPVQRILAHIGEPTEPPPIAPARPGATQSCFAWVPAPTIPGWGVRCSTAAHPPGWDNDLGAMPDWDLLGQPEPEVGFDQRIAW